MKVKDSTQTNQKKERMIAEEVSFAKFLAGNDKKLRDRAVKKLIKWLAVRSKGKTAFTEENFQRIWSGLFYCMWMSDKFLIQEELAESISKLVHCFNNNNESALLFIKCFFKIMGLEWPGIDQHRIDKFCMLIRRFLRQSLEYSNKKDWDVSLVKSLTSIFEETVINTEVPNGFVLHFIDIFLEELAKVSKGKMESEIILIFLEPFIKITATTKDSRIHRAIALLFNHLIRQTDVGIEYEEKLRAWKEMEMPCEKPEELEASFDNCQEEENEEGKDSELDEIVEETALDPRAGKVDAILPQIPIDCDGILKLIKEYQNNDSVTNPGLRELRTLEGNSIAANEVLQEKDEMTAVDRITMVTVSYISKVGDPRKIKKSHQDPKKFLKTKTRFLRLRRGRMPEHIRKPKILQDFKKKRRHTSKCVRELIEYTRKLNEEMDLHLENDEIDSDEELNNINNVSPEKDTSQSKDLHGPLTKKIKSKSKKKNKKNMKSPISSQKENKEVKRETKKKRVSNEKYNKKEAKAKKTGLKTQKPKSPKATFKVEDVKEGSESLMITPNKKRKSLDSWIVDDLDNKEDNEIVRSKIIKLETETVSISPEEIKDSATSKECDTQTESETPQVKLSAAFWEKAREKIFKKKKNSLPNPAFFDQSKNSRRISFALDRNETQENEEYIKEVRNSPSIPFDGSRKPVQSALKSGLHPSPINPFYRFNKFH